MRIGIETAILIAGAWLMATPALAQDTTSDEPEETLEIKDEIEIEEEAAPASESGDDAAAQEEQPPQDPLAPGALTQERTYEIRRGFFARGDFGVFFAFGGSDVLRAQSTTEAADCSASNGDGCSPNSATNIQPMVAATVGYDIIQNSKFNLAAGGRFAALFVNGSAQVPDGATLSTSNGQITADILSVPADLDVYQIGAALDFTYMVNERLGILVHGDGGISVIQPDPDLTATNVPIDNEEDGGFVDGAGDPVIGGIFSAGAGVEYATKLTGFSVGATVAFYGVLSSESFIPGLGIYIPLKYNF